MTGREFEDETIHAAATRAPKSRAGGKGPQRCPARSTDVSFELRTRRNPGHHRPAGLRAARSWRCRCSALRRGQVRRDLQGRQAGHDRTARATPLPNGIGYVPEDRLSEGLFLPQLHRGQHRHFRDRPTEQGAGRASTARRRRRRSTSGSRSWPLPRPTRKTPAPRCPAATSSASCWPSGWRASRMC